MMMDELNTGDFARIMLIKTSLEIKNKMGLHVISEDGLIRIISCFG